MRRLRPRGRRDKARCCSDVTRAMEERFRFIVNTGNEVNSQRWVGKRRRQRIDVLVTMTARCELRFGGCSSARFSG